MRVLVTGATGFVGRALVPELTLRGYDVRAAVRDRSAPSFPPQVEVVSHGDLAWVTDWAEFVLGCDAIVHLAGVAHTGPEVSPEYHDRINRVVTENLVYAAKRGGIAHFVFVSSIRAQCGPTATHVLTETDEAVPTDAYGISKLSAERIVRGSGLRCTILRPVLVYGPGVKGNLAALARLVDSAWPLPFGALINRRSLLNRASLIDAIEFALRTPACADETFIVADCEPIALNDLVIALRSGVGRSPHLVSVPRQILRAALRIAGRESMLDRLEGDLVASPAKLIAAGWVPTGNTAQAVERMARGICSS